MPNKEIHVSIEIEGKTEFVGRLFCHNRNGKESADFEYDKTWLENPLHFSLEPALELTQGSFHTQGNQPLFGAIGDSAPDRWGRTLMKRAEDMRAREEKRTARSFSEGDFLLGVNDRARMGALRFSLPQNPETYLADDTADLIPPLIDLPKLLNASENFLNHPATQAEKNLKLLLTPGSSLGGARAKASVMDVNGDLYIAKFPQKNDMHNVILWEILTLELAKNAGLNVPEWRRKKINGKDILLLRRFDRNGAERIPFLSAMSMLGGEDMNGEHNYLEIADALTQYGAASKEDKRQLWRRIIFNILVSNTDDHLRNHAFLYNRNGSGWRLSPAYDMNPVPDSRFLSTAITDDGNNSASLDLALSVAEYFGLKQDEAKQIAGEVARAVSQWRNKAKSYGLSADDTAYMKSAFEHQDADKARTL